MKPTHLSLLALLALTLWLNACSPQSLGAPTPTPTPTSTLTPTLPPTPTETPTPTPTQTLTPTPTETPTPEFNMTLEDWEKLFNETYAISVFGKRFNVAEELFKYSDLVTDSNTLRNLENSAGIIILSKDGTIILPIDKDKAADLIDNGFALAALVAKERNVTVASEASLMVIVAGQAYKDSGGNSNIHITFGKIEHSSTILNDYPSSLGQMYNIVTFTEPDGTITAPYMNMPPHFIIGTDKGDVSLEDLGLEYNEHNWLDVCIKAGARQILIYGW